MSTWQASLLTYGSFYEPSLPSATAPVGRLASLTSHQAADDQPAFAPADSVHPSWNRTISPLRLKPATCNESLSGGGYQRMEGAVKEKAGDG